MFERFTDRARRVVVLAQEEARLMNHNYIGPEHVFLGLLDEGEGVAFKVLDANGATLGRARTMVAELCPPGEMAPTGHIPFTDEAKWGLEKSLREALTIGHNYIGTEHILLGAIAQGYENTDKLIVGLCECAPADIREATMELLRSYAPTPAIASPEPEPVLPLLVDCFSLLSRMEPRHRAASLAYLNAWFAS